MKSNKIVSFLVYLWNSWKTYINIIECFNFNQKILKKKRLWKMIHMLQKTLGRRTNLQKSRNKIPHLVSNIYHQPHQVGEKNLQSFIVIQKNCSLHSNPLFDITKKKLMTKKIQEMVMRLQSRFHRYFRSRCH